MKELTITAASYLLIGFIGITGLVFSLLSMRKDNRRRIYWFTLAVVCLCAVVLFADSLEKVQSIGNNLTPCASNGARVLSQI
jgi:hypothetical protein